ncbi:MAG: phosphatase PAP2 family protein [Emcibacter sp.]|nr:phosphatase PAP2 family protein [Emcibacter sp.]
MDYVAVLRRKIEVDGAILRGNIILMALFATQAAAIYLVLWHNDLLNHYIPSLYASILITSLIIVVFVKSVSYSLRYLGYDDGERNLKRVKDDFLKGWINVNYMVAFLLPMVFLPTFISLFSSLKSVVHLIHPFYLDEFLMKADRFIHFGIDPWRITHAVFSTAFLSVVLNYFYNLWFFIMFSYVLWMVVNVHFNQKRMRFLLTFIMIWTLIGSFLAVLLSSAGPCFYGDVVGDKTVYGPLMDILRSYDKQYESSFFGIFALNTQNMLWMDYLKNDTNIGSGISAMPSMHVSVAALLYFSGRDVNKYIGYGMGIFLVMIQIGSVHLGWHYAVDGYVSIFLTWLVWRFAGWLVKRIYKEDEASLNNQVQYQPQEQIG